jgi:hypothetical protein
MRNVGSIEVADRNVGCGRVKKQLVRGESDVLLAREDDSLGTFLECGFELLKH